MNQTIGILAHVDAGKTTLAESILYLSGSIRKLGRVDNKDAFLDTYELERARGITIFAKQAVFSLKENRVTLLDTPGHVDFSAEMERTLQVLDAAILVISGADGVQGHTQTLWRLLKRYQIPTFLFVNKMDQAGTDRTALLTELQERLEERCIDFTADRQTEYFRESIAMCDENLLERYLEKAVITQEDIAGLVRKRKLFPCYFGSALKLTGVEELLQGIWQYTIPPDYPSAFGARVFKISRDEQGNRLTHLKITGGVLGVKDLLPGTIEEKVNQIRIYSGTKYEMVSEAQAGIICAVTGLNATFPGEGLGMETGSYEPVLEPVLTYQIILPPECDTSVMLGKIRQLEEEEPQLHIVWDEALQEIQAQLMGEIQIEILKSLIYERFGVEAAFGTGHILYKETIAEVVEGIGHFEPLRHYAEVHLLLEPGEPGSGLQFETNCSEDILDKNWQRLILTHLKEKTQRGVLTGSEITDMKIILITGHAHQKHTEGGDFRQATYRAVRQGLMQATTILLEPVFDFRMELPSELVGRAMADIDKMQGSFGPPEAEGEYNILVGTVPVSTMRDYQLEFHSYTRGRGRLYCTLRGYEPCHNTEQIVAEIGYDPGQDLENPAGSVFCAHGAGFIVPWDQVAEYAHVESGLQLSKLSKVRSEESRQEQKVTPMTEGSYRLGVSGAKDRELEAIFARTFPNSRQDPLANNRQTSDPGKKRMTTGENVPAGKPGSWQQSRKDQNPVEEYLLVDGYNIIFAWEELNEIAGVNMDGARGRLMDILCNYQAVKKCILLLVFDAYRVEGHETEILNYHNIYVVYTAQAETADRYIERTAHEIGRKYHVTVATSDGAEQVIVWGQGCNLYSARELREEVEAANQELRENYLEKQEQGRHYLFDHLPEDLAEHMEAVRLGKKEF